VTATETPDVLLVKGVTTAYYFDGNGPDWLADQLAKLDWPREQLAAVLARALRMLAQPARIGDLRDLAAELTEALFDNAHGHCDHVQGCTGGRKPQWAELVENALMPVLREYMLPEDRPASEKVLVESGVAR
jgi:hypothetical protein